MGSDEQNRPLRGLYIQLSRATVLKAGKQNETLSGKMYVELGFLPIN